MPGVLNLELTKIVVFSISDMLARQAMQLIAKNIRTAYADGSNLANNPRQLTQKDAEAIYRSVL